MLFILPKGGEIVNEQNLIPLNKRSKTVQREIQEKGRQANKAKHALKRSIKEAMLVLRDCPLENEKIKERIKNNSTLQDDEITEAVGIAYLAMQYAKKGNAQWGRLLFEMLGENDVQGVSKIPGALHVNFSSNPEDFK